MAGATSGDTCWVVYTWRTADLLVLVRAKYSPGTMGYRRSTGGLSHALSRPHRCAPPQQRGREVRLARRARIERLRRCVRTCAAAQAESRARSCRRNPDGASGREACGDGKVRGHHMPEGGAAAPAAARDDVQLLLQRAAGHDPAAPRRAHPAGVVCLARGRGWVCSEGGAGVAEGTGGGVRQVPPARVAEELPAAEAGQALSHAHQQPAHLQLCGPLGRHVGRDVGGAEGEHLHSERGGAARQAVAALHG